MHSPIRSSPFFAPGVTFFIQFSIISSCSGVCGVRSSGTGPRDLPGRSPVLVPKNGPRSPRGDVLYAHLCKRAKRARSEPQASGVNEGGLVLARGVLSLRAMRFDKLTIKSQEALQEAQSNAASRGHSEVA